MNEPESSAECPVVMCSARLHDLTNNRQSPSNLIFMRRLRTMLAVFLAVFWLFATQHCGLEAAGVLAQHCEQPVGSHGRGGADHDGDGCKTVESGEYKIADATSKVPAPQLIACFCLICLDRTELQSTAVVESLGRELLKRPRDWVSTWQFVQRAALSPRAPSLGLA